jgi:hypothetical protein
MSGRLRRPCWACQGCDGVTTAAIDSAAGCGLGGRSQREKEGLVADLARTGASMRVGPVASRKLFAFLTASDPYQEVGDFGALSK